jgi:hypothetical protein
MASRTDVRATENSSQSCLSAGIRDPGEKWPARIESII